MTQQPLRIGIVGSGAVVEWFHLPALARSRDVAVTAIVDKNLARARTVAARFPGASAHDDYRELVGAVDAALVAVPNALHAPVGAELLRRGVHVLLEKPMAVTAAECDALEAAAGESGATLAVGLVRRFSDSTRLIRDLLCSGVIGRVERAEISEGGVFSWPVTSDALFRKDLSGGGVLIDVGVHILDVLLYWLGPVASLRYRDDARGGVESECRLELAMKSGTECVLEFSRIRRMRGMVFRGSEGTLEIGSGFDPEIRLRRGGSSLSLAGHPRAERGRAIVELEDAFDEQLADFVAAVRDRRPPAVSAAVGRQSVEVIEACYAAREDLELPWTSSILPTSSGAERDRPPYSALRGKTVLVLGATGFIGSRVVERLVLDCGANVRTLVRNFARAPRIARLGVEMLHGDLTDAASVERAARGCDLVIHSAYGNAGTPEEQRRSTVDGTRNALEAARAAGATRVVYLSTLDVYGMPEDRVLDETAERRFSRRFYGDTKLEAENAAVEYARAGLPVAILQPTVVYGPFAPSWTIGPLTRIRDGQFAVLGDGGGYCNAVYIDDLVQAILVAAVEPRAVGETFLISGERPVTWREFYGAYARMLGRELLSIAPEESLARFRDAQRGRHLLPRLKQVFRENEAVREQVLTSPEIEGVKTMVRTLMPRKRWNAIKAAAFGAPPRHDPLANVEGMPPEQVEYYAARMTVSIDKARRTLGYSPAYSMERGMEETERWARWAHLIA